MTLAQGDAFVVGDIFSFQQAERIRANWRAVSEVSNPQAGSLWSQSSTERLFHRQASAYAELVQNGVVLGDNFEILYGAGGVLTIPGSPLHPNLLDNSGFGFWSQSDANEGLGTLTYDNLAVSIFQVGETITGQTSGAVGKVITDISSVLMLGACSGRFQDDEQIVGGSSGATADVNMPDTAAGVDLVRNGEFEAGVDGWTPIGTATLTSEADGQVGNCMKVAVVDVNKYASQAITVEVGKIYKVSVWFKNGDAAHGDINVGISQGTGEYFIWAELTDAGWTEYTGTFEAITTTCYIRCNVGQAAKFCYFDEITLYEITPCCTGDDILAFDGWYKNTNLNLYRQHNDGGTLTKDGSFYSLKIVREGSGTQRLYWNYSLASLAEFTQQFAGRPVTLGMWVKTSAANHARLNINDGAHVYSIYHTGGGAWEWLEVTDVISVDVSTLDFSISIIQDVNVDGSTIVYVSQPTLVFGSSIGVGNYQPKQDEWIYGEKFIPSNKYDNTADWSDVEYAVLNLEADSNGKIPKGIKAVMIHIEASDTGSGAVTDLHVHCRKDSTASRFFTLCFAGKLNNAEAHAGGMQSCNMDGDIEVELKASGEGTLTISRFRFLGIQVN